MNPVQELERFKSLLNKIQGRSNMIIKHISEKVSPLHPIVLNMAKLNIALARLLSDTASYMNTAIFKEAQYIRICDHIVLKMKTIEQDLSGDLDMYVESIRSVLQDSRRLLGRMMNLVHRRYPLHYPRFDMIRENVASPTRTTRGFTERKNQTRVEPRHPQTRKSPRRKPRSRITAVDDIAPTPLPTPVPPLPIRETSTVRRVSDFMTKFIPRWNMNFVFPRTKPVEPKSKTLLTETFKKNMKTATSQKALSTIKTAMRNSEWYLSIVCSRSGTCLAFGNRVLEINKLFQYNRFQHVVFMTPLSSGGNGDTVGIKYELPRKRYSSVAVLKSSKNLYSDNLMYEYMAGIHFVNHMVPKYPVFLFTYGIYTRTRDITDISQLKTDLTLQGTNFDVACQHSDKLSLLLQHVEGKTLQDMLIHPEFILNDLSKMLFMIYQTLSSLAKQFTHYDLHPSNVMIMELDSPIEYVYHDEKISFTSKYLPKIIDYGRCYFNEDRNSKDVYLEICSTPSCHVDGLACGKSRGFGWLKPTVSRFAVNSAVKNESHDLFLLYRINKLFEMHHLYPYVPTLVYGQGLPPEQSHYGTVENLRSPIGQVTNVHSAKDLMKRYLRMNNISQLVTGRLHIFKDKPMDFENVS